MGKRIGHQIDRVIRKAEKAGKEGSPEYREYLWAGLDEIASAILGEKPITPNHHNIQWQDWKHYDTNDWETDYYQKCRKPKAE